MEQKKLIGFDYLKNAAVGSVFFDSEDQKYLLRKAVVVDGGDGSRGAYLKVIARRIDHPDGDEVEFYSGDPKWEQEPFYIIIYKGVFKAGRESEKQREVLESLDAANMPDQIKEALRYLLPHVTKSQIPDIKKAFDDIFNNAIELLTMSINDKSFGENYLEGLREFQKQFLETDIEQYHFEVSETISAKQRAQEIFEIDDSEMPEPIEKLCKNCEACYIHIEQAEIKKQGSKNRPEILKYYCRFTPPTSSYATQIFGVAAVPIDYWCESFRPRGALAYYAGIPRPRPKIKGIY